MPGYKPLKTEYFGEKCNVLFRLNRDDTITLKERLNEILEKDAGVNLILLNMNGGISMTESDERGRQLKFIAFSDEVTFSPETEQRGYTRKWSHIEICTNLKDGLTTARRIIKATENPTNMKETLHRWMENPAKRRNPL